MKATKMNQRPIINMDPMVPSISTNLWEEEDLDMPMGELANSHQNIFLDPQLFHPMLNPNPSPFSTFQYSSLPPNSPNCHEDEEKEEEEEEEEEEGEEEEEKLGAMKEMMYRIAAMQPVDIDPETIKRPQRKNVRISDDPQSVAARQRRERISDRIRILRSLVPGGTKMDTASMLDEAVSYVKFLKRQVHRLKRHHRHQQSSQIPAPPCAIVSSSSSSSSWHSMIRTSMGGGGGEGSSQGK